MILFSILNSLDESRQLCAPTICQGIAFRPFEGLTRRYLSSRREIRCSALSGDEALQERLWRVRAQRDT